MLGFCEGIEQRQHAVPRAEVLEAIVVRTRVIVEAEEEFLETHFFLLFECVVCSTSPYDSRN